MAEPSSKKQLRDTKQDIISSLPDSLLLHILSFLPLRTCVMTSFLSPRWRDVWKDLQVMDLDEFFEDFESQAVFVNSAFRLSNSFNHLRKLRLPCYYRDGGYGENVPSWLEAVCGPKSHLEELEFLINRLDDEIGDEEDVDARYFSSLPPALFVCTNLVKLNLSGGIFLNLESLSEVRLSSLKTLQIKYVSTDTTSMNVLLAGCPVLEDLYILLLFLENYGGICVPSSLKRLKIQVVCPQIEENWGYLKINAPGLEYLQLGQMSFDRVSVSTMYNLQNVIKAVLDLEPVSRSPDNYTSALLEFLHLLTGIKHLVLSHETTKWLLSASELNFPEYRHLRRLEIILPCFNSYLVFSLLEKCDALQVLNIQVLIIQNDQASTVRSNLPKWVQKKTSVSNCLESHLRSLRINGFHGSKDEMRFARYILQKGLVLNTVNITSNLKKKLRILKKLSNMPRGSAYCRLQFD